MMIETKKCIEFVYG